MAIATFEIYGRKYAGYLILIAELQARAALTSGRSPIAKEPARTRKFGNHVTVHRPTARPSDRPYATQENQCLLSHFLTTLGAQEKSDCMWSVMDTWINWQLSKQGNDPLTSITWPYRGSGVDPLRSSTFLKLSPDKLLVFKWSQAQVYFFQWFISNMLCLSLWPHTIKILILN